MIRNLAAIAHDLDTDKKQSGYLVHYERHLGHLRNLPIKLLELGVLKGGSLLMWQKYFDKGLIVGVDSATNPLKLLPERIQFYQGSQEDSPFLDRVAQECAPDGFDIIIDDAAHIGTLARASFRCLFVRHLKSGGIYVIEDWGTGYWDSWPDGSSYQNAGLDPEVYGPQKDASVFQTPLTDRPQNPGSAPHPDGVDSDFAKHNFGMVGFIKELIDEVAWPDITHTTRGNPDLPKRPSMIREIVFSFGMAFILKA
jgi:hypothetical protein